jgi:hypothetical protein
LKSRRISVKVKLNVYKTIIRPIVTHACETWVLTRKDELTVLIRERKVLRRISGPICERGCYRVRTNEKVRRTRLGNYNYNMEDEMARPCKQKGRSQRAKQIATGHSWGWNRERKSNIDVAG